MTNQKIFPIILWFVTGICLLSLGQEKKETEGTKLNKDLLSRTVLQNISFDETPILDCLSRVQNRWKPHAGGAILPLVHSLTKEDCEKKVTFKAVNVNVLSVLHAICRQANLKMKCTEEAILVFSPNHSIEIPRSPFENQLPTEVGDLLKSSMVPRTGMEQVTFSTMAKWLNAHSSWKDTPFRFAYDQKLEDYHIDSLLFEKQSYYHFLRFLCGKTQTQMLFLPDKQLFVFVSPGTPASDIKPVIPSPRQEPQKKKNEFRGRIQVEAWSYLKKTPAGYEGPVGWPRTMTASLYFPADERILLDGSSVIIPWKIVGQPARGDLPQEVKIVPDEKGKLINVSTVTRTQKTVEQGKTLNTDNNWVLVEPKDLALDLNKKTRITIVNKRDNFGSSLFPAGETVVNLSLRLKARYKNGKTEFLTARTKTTLKLEKNTLDKEKNFCFIMGWLHHAGYFVSKIPNDRWDTDEREAWQRRTLLKIISVAEKENVKFELRNTAYNLYRSGATEKAYQLLEKHRDNLMSSKKPLGRRAKNDLIELGEKVGNSVGKPNPFEDWKK